MKFLISMILLLSITISAQTTLEKEIEKIKSNPNVKLHYLENNNLKIDYDKFTSRTFYLGSLKGNAKKQDSIPRFVFNLWELDTSLYIYKYQFWQEVPLGNYYKKPIIGDINGDNRIEYYGHKKDFFTENSGVYCYQQNAYGIFKQAFKYPSNTVFAYNIFDVNRDENLELHLYDTTWFRIDSINWGAIPNQTFFRKSMQISLADSLFFKFNIYKGGGDNIQLNDFTIADLDSDGVNEAIFGNFSPREIWITKFNEIDTTFDSIQVFPIPYIEDVAGFPIGDFDMDGKTDIVYAGAMGNIYLIECEGIDDYQMNWTGNTGVPNSYINFKTNDIDGNGKPEFWIGGEDFGYDFTKLICYESNGNNSYNPVAEIEFPYLLSLNPAEATSIDVDNDGKEEIFLRIGNVVVFIKFTGKENEHNFVIYYYHLFDQAIQSSIPYKFPMDNYPALILAMEYWQNGYGRAFTQMFKHYLSVDVEEKDNAFNNYNLFDCYPNPFNPSTTIKFVIGKPGSTIIKVYNSLGKEITTLINEYLPSGEKEITWDGKDDKGNTVSSGVYFIQITAGSYRQTIKAVLLK